MTLFTTLDRRQFMQGAAAAARTAAVTRARADEARGAAGTSRPNIVWFHSDSHDGRILRAAGHPAAVTPNLDRLARRGVLFRNACRNSPIYVPSRGSMWTGRHIHRVGAWTNDLGLPDDAFTLDKHLAKHGYEARLLGRLDRSSHRHGEKGMVATWLRTLPVHVPVERLRAKVLSGALKRNHEADLTHEADWIRQRQRNAERPFFLHIGVLISHYPFEISGEWLDKISAGAVANPPEDRAIHPCMAAMRKAKNDDMPRSDDEIRLLRRVYYAMVAETDALAGKVLDAVKAADLESSTICLYTSDHGETALDHGQTRKCNMYEGSVRVPMVIAGPGIPAGVVIERPVSLLDLFPSIARLAETPVPDGLDGRSLLPLLSNKGAADFPPVVSQYHAT